MTLRLDSALWLIGAIAWGGLADGAAAADVSPETAAIEAAEQAFVKDFNAGQPAAVAAHFLPKAELIDQEGRVHHGREEIQKLFTQFFAKYPGTKLALELESVRPLGDTLLVEEGTRYLTSKDAAYSQVRYVAIRAKSEGAWRIASIREFNDDPLPTAGEQLAPLAWLVGDWVSEGSDAVVKLSYRWSEDKNFLLGEFQATRNGQPLLKSSQRIGWDAAAGQVGSWTFDADGGFAQGAWSRLEDSWVIRSTATLADGGTGSATVAVLPKDKNQFVMRGTDRIVGDARQDDFELTISRAPPAVKPAGAARP